MKKMMIFVLVLSMFFCLAGCQSGGEGQQNQSGGDNAAEQIFSFTYKDVTMKLADPAEPILEKLGEPIKYTESASCAFDGLDKSYYYGSFYLETYPQGDKDFVYGWWFADDSVSTPEGIYIGSAQADVEKAYGAENFNGTNAFTVKEGNGTLTIILEEGVVTSIQYTMNIA